MTVIDEIAGEVAEFEGEHGRKPAQMLLTSNDKFSIGKLRGSEFPLAGKVMQHGVERVVTQLFGVPIAGWNAAERQYYSATPFEAPFSAQKAQTRISDWIKRLKTLFDRLEAWSGDIPGARIDRSEMDQQIEGLMEQFAVKARKVPTFTIFLGKNRIAFVPSALWIVGANGRINVTTNYRQYALVDLGSKDGASSDWRLLLPSAKNNLAPFDKALFLKLTGDKA